VTPVDGGATGRAAVKGGDLLPRVGSSIVLIAIAAAGAWWGGLATAIVVALLVVVVHFEWTGITEGRALAAAGFTAAVAAAMLVAGLGYPGAAAAITVMATIAAAATGPRPWRPMGVLYASVLGLSLLVLRESDNGLGAIAFLFAAVWATDIGAYFAGRALGGPKLWPAVSPKKTWSGAAGGLIAAILAGLATAAVIGAPVVAMLVAVAAVLSVAGQCGDLFESHVKRRFGTKDASHIIPGHGGMMDRVDGLVFAGAVAVLIGFLHSAGMDVGRGLVWW
jgi:phosphatidate cytidylyltransferase